MKLKKEVVVILELLFSVKEGTCVNDLFLNEILLDTFFDCGLKKEFNGVLVISLMLVLSKEFLKLFS